MKHVRRNYGTKSPVVLLANKVWGKGRKELAEEAGGKREYEKEGGGRRERGFARMTKGEVGGERGRFKD
jgi:hypothetical protein